jgi:GDP/UDP-N,N'-diacetylbacillosamine 2-epimerase (hydrolysing)
MKIGVLTSSRADYGIYLPLLERLKRDSFFQLEIIAFGTHLSKIHGYTLDNIVNHGYKTIHKISIDLSDDSVFGIAKSYANTVFEFSDFWKANTFDLVLCLGDRFEMSAAVQAGIPFEVKFAHIHGGETTLGAIDNIYRHQITLGSIVHFTSALVHSDKIATLIGKTENIFTVGALSLDEVDAFQPIPKNLFLEKFNLKDQPFILVTFHPETVSTEHNIHFAKETNIALCELSKQFHIVVTMPNADVMGSIFRQAILEAKQLHKESISLIENFGKINYFNAMYYASLMLGNTSSGIIEAASFHKYVINVGDRQKGRIHSANVLHVPFDAKKIYEKVIETMKLGNYKGSNIYYLDGAADNIIRTLKSLEW